MDIFQSIILGIVQGLGEFLPISSTAHLVLVPYFTGWQDPGLSFDIALHVGTLVAVLSFFYRDWIDIFLSSFKTAKTGGWAGFKKEKLYYLIMATIPGVVIGLLLEEKAETTLRSPLLIACALIFGGALLFFMDKKFAGEKKMAGLSLKEAVIIGFAQALAIIPGLSRSGMTISAGLWRGLSRSEAARFSFLLSTPIIAGAAVLKIPELIEAGIDTPMMIGIAASAISGYLAIKYLLKFLEKYGYAFFFWYRLVLGLIILLFAFL